MTLWTVTLTHYDIGNATETTITDNFISIPKCTDTGTTEVNSATLVLSASNGKFITSSPIIDEFDRIRISIVDEAGGEYSKVFDVIKIIPSWTKREGVRVTLILQGMEHNLQKINHIKPFFYEGASNVITDIINSYNNSKGSKQPTLTEVKNELPTANFSVNNYDFAVSQDSCFNRFNEVVDKQGSSVDDGGALDFYEIRYTNHVTDFTTLTFNGFTSGNQSVAELAASPQKVNGHNIITISETTSVNVGESESGIDSITGTVVHAWGAVDQGSLPTEFSQFKSSERRFTLYPRWITGITYKVNSKVQNGAIVYKCTTENTSDEPPSGNWAVRTANDDYGILQYSPWTVSRAGLWADSGIDPSNINSSGEIGQGFVDGNVIVQDTQDNWFRTIVDVRVATSNPQPSHISTYTGSGTDQSLYLYEQTDFYRGFRVLLQHNSNPAGKWAGSDVNGKNFKQSIIECVTPGDTTTATWRVVYGATTDKLVCTVRDEGITYIYNTGANTWASQGMNTEGDHLHPYTSLTNVSGIPNQGDGTFTNNTNSAIQARYDFTTFPIVSATDVHRIGAWLNFTFPFPSAKIVGLVNVGFFYGGGIDNRDVEAEPATLDVQNMHVTHDGFRGFNAQDDSSEDFGQISSLDFWMNLHYQDKIISIGSFATVLEANFKMTCFIVDTEDNIVSQEFTIAFNNQWNEYKLPISGFKIYRGRKPNDSLITTIVPPKKLEVSNIFRWRNVKRIIWQTQESYDQEGRYRTDVFTNRYMQAGKSIAGLGATARTEKRIDLAIDALHFTKPLLVNTGQDTTRCIENEFIEKPEIMDYYQLKNDANAELEKRNFRHVEFDITTTGKTDILFGDYFLYENSNLIPDEFETSGGSNKIKLVAKHIEYSITKPVNGKGGFLRRILGVRRFV